MMGILLGSMLSVAAANVSPATIKAYDLHLKLKMDGKQTASRILVKEGEKTVIQEDLDQEFGRYIEIVAKEASSEPASGIRLEMSVWRVDQNATKTLVSRPTIVTAENEEATISQGREGAVEPDLSVSVQATRKSL